MNVFLLIGALLSALAALLHIALIVFGASWYRFFGAGEKLTSMVEQGRYFPHFVAFGIAMLLVTASAYALAGAGLLPAMPLMKMALIVITALYCLRGIVGFWFVFNPTAQFGAGFALWSSVICLGFGLVHLLGLMSL